MPSTKPPPRYRIREDYKTAVPVHVVWELTLGCNLKCAHCGSRAGKTRPGELTTAQCFEVIDSLKRLGTREITLIGGEAFLRKDWLQIIEYITRCGIDCAMQTGGYNLNEERIIASKKAGLKGIGVSIDGLQAVHNKIRGRADSFEQATRCLEWVRKHEMHSGVNTVITQLNKHQLAELADLLIAHGVKNWQIQLAVAMGNAVDNAEELLIQPYELIGLYDNLAKVYEKALAGNLLIQAGNNIGYFGPYEYIWRQGSEKYFSGCTAGHTIMGIEADGNIKGCPSLPTTDYTGGNIKEMQLEDIWKHNEILFFSRYRNKEELWGGCKDCYYAASCLAGCTWTSQVLLGKRGNNPYCHYRALELQKKGLRERVRKIQEAPGHSFDTGLFEVVVENEQGEIVEVQQPGQAKDVPLLFSAEPRMPEPLVLCHGCNNYNHEAETDCHFCGADIKTVNADYDEKMQVVIRAMEKLEALMMAQTAAAT